MLRSLFAAVCALGFLAAAGAARADPPAARPFLFGVGTHYAFPLSRGYRFEATGPLLRSLGVDSFRDDVDADYYVDPTPDRVMGTSLARLDTAVQSRSATPVLIMRGRTIEREPKPRLAPRSDGERADYGRFAATLAQRTEPFAPIYEIWNEWNMQWRERPRLGGVLSGRENPDYSPENYVAAAKTAYEAVKATNPDAVVLTGSIGEDADWTWTRRALAAGLLETGDGVSVHFYNHCAAPADRTAEDLVRRVEDFRRVVAETGGANAPPLYVTEFGWPNDNGPCGIDRELAASNVAQFTLWSATVDWVRGIWAYELRDSGQSPDDREDNFGLYDYENRPKPAACAYREAIALSREIGAGRFRDTPEGVRWLEGTTGAGEPVWVFWATARDGRARVRLPDGLAATARTLCAGDAQAAASSIDIASMPVVVRPAEGGRMDDVVVTVD